jgi:hypothetical protein
MVNVIVCSERMFVPRRLASARGRRVVYHAVQHGYQSALCFAEPGQRSGWAEPAGEAVTCTRCLARLSRLTREQSVAPDIGRPW